MIVCDHCQTLNSDAARQCVACGRNPGTTRATGPGSARCVAGHPVDPEWPSCPYCDRAAAGRTAAASGTRIDFEQGATTPLAGSRRQAPFAANGAVPAPTRLDSSGAAGRTVLQETPRRPSGGFEPAGHPPARLVAVLAAPDLGPGGAIFPVRAGKTVLGADRGCDVPIAGDARVSAEHAVLLYRDGVFHLTDRLSTNGTWINGLEVPANGTVTLRDRDRLRLGDTLLVLLIVDGVPALAGSHP